MKHIRFFYAEQSYRTWPKLFVLTEDGNFYCEYLNYHNPTIFKEQFDYSSFEATTFKWNGYQSIVEIDQNTAIRKNLKNQANWILKYINSL